MRNLSIIDDAGPGEDGGTGLGRRPALGWYLRMAWRDSRKNRGRLLLFISSIVLGIAALVSTLSFGHNLRLAIDDQAKMLVGADLVLSGPRPMAPKVREIVQSAPERHSEERSFASMILFEKSGQSRLVQVRAISGDYPFYGVLGTTPAPAGMSFREGQEALVDKTLMLQFGAHAGDSVRIGNLVFTIAGSLDQAPGRNEISMTVAPPVYIPLRYLDPAGLARLGSRMEYRYYFQYPKADIRSLLATMGPQLEKAEQRYETVDSRKRQMNRGFGDLTQFLTLISFIALLLGCVGVGSSVNIYVREKIMDVAVLRCLGLKAWPAFFVYLIQVVGIGLIGAAASAVSGLTDWHKTDGRARRVGIVHGMLNLTATGLYIASWVLRKRREREAARVCGWLGFAVSGVAGYLGGELVYSEKIGVDHADRTPLQDGFISLMPEADLEENTPHLVEVRGVKVVLVRQSGKIFALQNTCSHLGGPLVEGKVEGDGIRCPWHGSCFALEDGKVQEGPATYPQPTYEVRIINGNVELRRAEIPALAA